MRKSRIGIDMGASELKLVVCSGSTVQKTITAPMPDNLLRDGAVVSPESMGQLIKDTLTGFRAGTKNCSIVLPDSLVFTRTLQMPPMTQSQLTLNLPFEFRDYITQEKDKYYYDYAITNQEFDENEQLLGMEMFAAATLKETITSYHEVCKRAGLKLVAAAPIESAYMNLINDYVKRNHIDEDKDYCFIDLGHTVTRMFIYKGIQHEATRVMDMGLETLDEIIAEHHSTDRHIAHEYKHANKNQELELDRCLDIYNNISLETMRALKFYKFNSPDSNLEEVYVCGGGSHIPPLLDALKRNLDVPVHSIEDFLPPSAGGNQHASVCQSAIGIAMM